MDFSSRLYLLIADYRPAFRICKDCVEFRGKVCWRVLLAGTDALTAADDIAQFFFLAQNKI